MHIIYAATTCTDKVYSGLFSNTKDKPGFQAQKYHRLLIEGLAANAGTEVDVVANPPVNRGVLKQSVVYLEDETDHGARYHYIHAYRNPIRKKLHVFLQTFFRTFRLARKDSAVIVDCLNTTAALSAQLAARLRRCHCVGIITDLPNLEDTPNIQSGSRMAGDLSEFVIRHCTDYVLLTEAINEYIQNPGKPYVVLEGHSDIRMWEQMPSLEKKQGKRICMYAGSINERYGLELLAKGFMLTDIPNTELHYYGSGSYLKEFLELAKQDSRLVYGGMLMPSEIVPKEMEATLLINPRPIDKEFVKYCFPSKTMEYMSTGTPVLMTHLPGLPKEYYPYLYFIEECTPEGIADALSRTFEASDEELFRMGAEARRFILEERNNVVQAGKILAMLEK